MPIRNVVTNQATLAMSGSILLRPSYTEIINGFEKTPGTMIPTAPNIIRCNGSFRNIFIDWDKQYNLTNLSHYVIQTSEDNINWYSLGFNGDWKDELDGLTITYGQEISHTRIPYKDSGSIRQLFYRVASVTLTGEQSPWSSIVIGNTTWIEITDLRDGFVYDGFGLINVSGQALSGIHMYIGSGSITTSGGANYAENNNYTYIPYSGNIEMSGDALTKAYYDYPLFNGSGNIDLSNGDLYGPNIRGSISYFYIQVLNISGGNLYMMNILDEDGNSSNITLQSGHTLDHYGQETSQMTLGESNGILTLTNKETWSESF